MKYRLYLLVAICIMMAMSLAASATTTTLDFSSLPSAQGWTYRSLCGWDESAVFSANGEMLHQDTMGLGFDPQTAGSYSMPSSLDASSSFTLTVRARVTAHEAWDSVNTFGYCFYVQNGEKTAAFSITNDRICQLSNDQQTLCGSDNTGFHDYMLSGSFAEDSWTLRRDDLIIGSGIFADAGGYASITFGDGTAGSNARGDLSYLSYTYSSVPEPSSILALLCGIGGMGSLIRRRKAM